jgi:phosphoribosylformylglycinamidine cyclo-ligase
LNRVLPPDLDAVVESASWAVPNVFAQLQRAGDVDRNEMFRAFNMGVGMVAIADAASVETIIGACESVQVRAWPLGRIVRGDGRVIIH